MNIYSPPADRRTASAPAKTEPRARKKEAVALVITLLMLSVITFLTIAFLAMSQRNKTAVSTSLDAANARAASDAALARAQTEVVAQMLAHGDALYYDWLVSSAFHSPTNFNPGEGYDPNNVNYDTFITNPAINNGANWAQMMANLWYDPSPPVFIITNQAYPTNYDFRKWIDINRNGRFETNGYQPTVYDNGLPTGSYEYLNGEPEWIGILRNPLYPHSSTNPFVARYAYMVLPIGKQLDINNIHNFLKGTYGNNGNLTNTSSKTTGENDGFARDQGIGSWELNLAGVLDAVSPSAYESNIYPYISISPFSTYNYAPPNPSKYDNEPNTGNAFDDAEAILHYRYPATSVSPFMAPLGSDFANYSDFYANYIDMYCQEQPLEAPFDYGAGGNGLGILDVSNKFPLPSAGPNGWSWPGSYQSNQFFDVQDLFDPNKTSYNFTNRMWMASTNTNTFDRYTFLRLLSCVGVGSSPEYGTWVYGDSDFTNCYTNDFNPMFFVPTNAAGVPFVLSPSRLRTKVNINYNNTAQITNAKAPYAAMPTTLVPWTPLGFFTNAAELLLRSQTFGYSTNSTNSIGITTQTNYFAHFGVTNIPIYRVNLPAIRYDSSVHRMLQLAANIYDATVTNTYISARDTNGLIPPPVRHPSIFRPLFGLAYSNTTPIGINIIGYAQVTNPPTISTPSTLNQLSQPFYDVAAALTRLTRAPADSNINIWGIPWVVGANKGLPQFYQYSYQSSILYERKLLFARYANASGLPDTNRPPQYTNQFYCMWVSNNFGVDAWNPYPSNFTGNAYTTCYISNYITVQFTNNYNYGVTTNITNVYPISPNPLDPPTTSSFYWTGWQKGITDSNGFITFFKTNVSTLPNSYFSPALNRLVPWTNSLNFSNQFLPVDTNQTGWPVYNWTLNITNHLVYALFDGTPGNGALLDFVNLGPFGNSLNIQQVVASTNYNSVAPGPVLGMTGTSIPNPWIGTGASDIPKSSKSLGLLNQIGTYLSQNPTYANNLNGVQTNTGGSVFGAAFEPSNVVFQTVQYVANDPMVHYTVDDLVFTNVSPPAPIPIPVSLNLPFPPLSNTLGTVNTKRYATWNLAVGPYGTNMLFIDPQMNGATNWDFPTHKFPGVGWLGRVHRGTPWQTVYLKADNPSGTTSGLTLGQNWTNWGNSAWIPGYEPFPETYPTNDWALVDLFTTAPDDNAARGLLSVNQTNDAAWAAVFAGIIAPTNFSDTTVTSNAYGGVQIMPNNNGLFTNLQNYTNFVDGPAGINGQRAYFTNGIFHKVGDILGASNLTTTSPLLGGTAALVANNPDEIVERIPQQTLSLLKVGEPQFVILAWGQALKPKGPPYLTLANGGANNNIYTNYEITGETLTRTVCHVVHTNGLKMVIDSFNVESGSGN